MNGRVGTKGSRVSEVTDKQRGAGGGGDREAIEGKSVRCRKFSKLSKHVTILKKKFMRLKKIINLSARNAP